jgi:hypothetical protein
LSNTSLACELYASLMRTNDTSSSFSDVFPTNSCAQRSLAAYQKEESFHH